MSVTTATPTAPPVPIVLLGRCLSCAAALDGCAACPCCGRAYPVVAGIWHAIGPLSGTNRTAAAFYNSALWLKFRPWEQLFLWFQGPGPRRARRQVLRHLPHRAGARVLEVGIGDGENLQLLPADWTVFGVDVALSRLEVCQRRFPDMTGRLAWAEAEALPFADGTFDAVYTVGGFNYFRDHAAALRELRRVARPGAPVIVADEVPDLYEYALGHMLGIEALDRWGLRLMGLDADFIDMVLKCRLDVAALTHAVWPHCRRDWIWNRLGYCFVDPDPEAIPPRGAESCP